MGGQVLGDELPVGQLFHMPTTVGQHDTLVLLVDLRVLDDTEEGREPGAGGNQVQVPAGQQVVLHQGTGGLAVDQHLVTHGDRLQFRGQRAVRHLDAEKFQLVLVVGAGQAVGAHQGLAALLKPYHGEVAVLEPKALVARGLEAEQPICPVVHRGDLFAHDGSHW